MLENLILESELILSSEIKVRKFKLEYVFIEMTNLHFFLTYVRKFYKKF